MSIYGILTIDALLKKTLIEITADSQEAINNTTNKAITESITALDHKSQSMLEDKTVMIAKEVASFLQERDQDLLFLSHLNINNRTLKDFYSSKMCAVHVPVLENTQVSQSQNTQHIDTPILEDNKQNFHKVSPGITRKKSFLSTKR